MNRIVVAVVALLAAAACFVAAGIPPTSGSFHVRLFHVDDTEGGVLFMTQQLWYAPEHERQKMISSVLKTDGSTVFEEWNIRGWSKGYFFTSILGIPDFANATCRNTTNLGGHFPFVKDYFDFSSIPNTTYLGRHYAPRIAATSPPHVWTFFVPGKGLFKLYANVEAGKAVPVWYGVVEPAHSYQHKWHTEFIDFDGTAPPESDFASVLPEGVKCSQLQRQTGTFLESHGATASFAKFAEQGVI